MAILLPKTQELFTVVSEMYTGGRIKDKLDDIENKLWKADEINKKDEIKIRDILRSLRDSKDNNYASVIRELSMIESLIPKTDPFCKHELVTRKENHCYKCDGSGKVWMNEYRTCPNCGGTGGLGPMKTYCKNPGCTLHDKPPR